ncbi:hypothetical protein PPERSA_09994 [Pseudocohnilembus persalinus]|uniref:Uncharacterized protein n=1 Tax=Pseudocohnilembus persalinus TaxID=266149 RepID=A0A0V0QJE4_PSEPJ|nr:hypothetical protein PPERSA_09994 [Pseudocohnilembus persalinus]|eukprot:KRX02377.1 hypothetical protein PPERSA_09994 [Pseudocohnilembus persalinus]
MRIQITPKQYKPQNLCTTKQKSQDTDIKSQSTNLSDRSDKIIEQNSYGQYDRKTGYQNSYFNSFEMQNGSIIKENNEVNGIQVNQYQDNGLINISQQQLKEYIKVKSEYREQIIQMKFNFAQELDPINGELKPQIQNMKIIFDKEKKKHDENLMCMQNQVFDLQTQKLALIEKVQLAQVKLVQLEKSLGYKNQYL